MTAMRTALRTAIAGVALLIAAAAPARAQHRAPRWGGGGAGVSPDAHQQQTHSRVAYQGLLLMAPGTPLSSAGISIQGRSSGGSWNGARPIYGGSPAAQPRPQGTDLSAFFGYVPPRGQTARIVPVHPVAQAPRTDARQHHSQITWPQRSVTSLPAARFP